MRSMIFAVSMLIAANAYAQDPAEWNESWRWCQFAHQCEVMKDECRNWTAVNSDYVEYAKKYFDYARPLMDCGEPLLLPPPKAECNIKARKCEVTYG